MIQFFNLYRNRKTGLPLVTVWLSRETADFDVRQHRSLNNSEWELLQRVRSRDREISAMKSTPDNKTITYYRLVKTERTIRPGQIATAALLTCATCGITIDSMGGPGDGQVCNQCGDLLKRGFARGCIVWDDIP